MESFAGRAAIAALLGCCSLGGCELGDLFDGGGDGRAEAILFVGHHTSVKDGEFPDYGSPGETRVFLTDTGWTVKLTRGFVVMQAAALRDCDGGEVPFEFFDGPVVEDLLAGDLEVFSAGRVAVEPGQYCGVRVRYGALADDGERSAAGRTVSLRIGAERDGSTTPYTIETDESFEVEVDFDEPLQLRADQPFPAELTIWKTYDRLFDGMDFANGSPADELEDELGGRVAETLAEQTSVSESTNPPAIDG